MTILLTDRAIGGSASFGAGRPVYSRLSWAEVGAGCSAPFFMDGTPGNSLGKPSPYNDFDCTERKIEMFSPVGFPFVVSWDKS